MSYCHTCLFHVLVYLLLHLLRDARVPPRRCAPPRGRARRPPEAAPARAEAHGRLGGGGGPARARAEWVPGLLAAPAGWFSHHSSPRSSAISTRDSTWADHQGGAGAGRNSRCFRAGLPASQHAEPLLRHCRLRPAAMTS